MKNLKTWQYYALFLKAERERQEMPFNVLAKKSNIHRTTVNRFFDLKLCVSLEKFLAISKALGLKVNVGKDIWN